MIAQLKRFIRSNWIYLLILIGLVFISYVNSLNAVFLSDDLETYVVLPDIQHISVVMTNPVLFLRPLLNYLIYHVFGSTPAPFRLMNIFFHLGSTLTLFAILTRMSKKPLPFFAAALFAVHPVLIESITWISGGSYAQYGFFILFSFLSYILAKSSRGWYIASIVSFLLALTSSEKAIAFPGILLVYELIFSDLKKNWKKLIPHFLLSFLWTSWYASRIGLRQESLGTVYYGAPVDIYNQTIHIPVAVVSYLKLIFWPHALTLYQTELYSNQPQFILMWVIFGLFLLLTALTYFKNKFIFFWLAFFMIALSPTLVPLNIAWLVAERYVYVGSMGIIIAFAWLLYKLHQQKKTALLSYGIFITLVILLMTRTIIRNIDWQDEDHLWVATGKFSDNYHVTHNNLGDVYYRHGDYAQSAKEFKMAIAINPNYADAYHNLGNTYVAMGEMKLAADSYDHALAINPYIWQSYQALASIAFNQKDYRNALLYTEKAIKIMPNASQLYSNLGIVYTYLKDKPKAIAAYQTALQLDPGNQKAIQGLSEVQQP